MDPATLVGLLLAFLAMFAMIVLEGANIMSIFLPAPMILVFFGTIAITLAGGTLKDGLRALQALPKAFRGKVGPPAEQIQRLVSLAEIARTEGLLALEAEARSTKDEFLARGLQSMADGIDGEALRGQLDDDISTKQTADAVPARFYSSMGAYAPTVGIIGTVVSLTHVLENLSEPDELGHMIAAAFVATLWGLVSSNFMWLPLGARLGRLSQLETARMNLVREGLLAIQEGIQPMLLEEKLQGMVPEDELSGAGRKTGAPASTPATDGAMQG